MPLRRPPWLIRSHGLYLSVVHLSHRQTHSFSAIAHCAVIPHTLLLLLLLLLLLNLILLLQGTHHGFERCITDATPAPLCCERKAAR